MELSYTRLKTKEVVNTLDGKKLGKVSDVVFLSPENCVIGIVACKTGKGLFPKHSEQYIDLKNVVKFGSDVVLVCLSDYSKKKRECKDGGCETVERRSFEDYE